MEEWCSFHNINCLLLLFLFIKQQLITVKIEENVTCLPEKIKAELDTVMFASTNTDLV